MNRRFSCSCSRERLFSLIVTISLSPSTIFNKCDTKAGCGFYLPWAFVAVSKQVETITESWIENEAIIDLKIRQRIKPNIHGGSSLLFFDGPTMARYRYPTKQMEKSYCANPVLPENCTPEKREFNPESFGSFESSDDLERLINYIHVEKCTDRVVSNFSDLHDNTTSKNRVLTSYKANFGVQFVKRNVSATTGADEHDIFETKQTESNMQRERSLHPPDYSIIFIFLPAIQGYGIAAHHVATESTPKASFVSDTTSSFNFVGSDIHDTARLRRSFFFPMAKNNL
jgi:hypothetical protein